MSRAARWLLARWYGQAPVPWWLALLERLFRLMVAVRRGLYRRGWLACIHPGVPVLVVGNLVVGGSGKTPLVIAIVEQLKARGWKPGVVSRGYGRRSRGLRHVAADSRASDVGDEPMEIHAATGVAVAVAADRVAAARSLVEDAAVDCIVADDGLQHYRLRRDIEIVTVDARRGFGNGRMLPAGPLREPRERLKDADLVLLRGGDDPNAWHLEPRGLRPLRGGTLQPLSDWRGRSVRAVAGIADPNAFVATLRAAGIEVLATRAFPDHHVFCAKDLRFPEPGPVVVTGKDAVKLTALDVGDVWVLEVVAHLPVAAVEYLLQRLSGMPAR